MKTENKLKLAGVLLGSTLITATAAFASGHEAKCGSGSCGDKKAKAEKIIKKDKDGKCGTGSCGDKAASKEMDDKAKKLKQASKSTEAKCGTGKCG